MEFSELAAGLKHARITAGFSQVDLADRMGLTGASISRIETGKRESTLSTLNAWAEKCGFELKVDLVKPGESQALGAPLRLRGIVDRLGAAPDSLLRMVDAMLAAWWTDLGEWQPPADLTRLLAEAHRRDPDHVRKTLRLIAGGREG